MTSWPRQSRRRCTGREGPQLTNSLGEIAPRRRRGVVPRQTSSLWNIGPTGRCFKTNPQHTRPLSGANLSSGVRIAFRRRTTTGRSSSTSQTGKTPMVQEGNVVDRLGPGIYVCKTNPPRRRRRMWSRGRVGEEERAPRLLMPPRLRLSVINLIEALFLVDCGSKKSRRALRLKRGNETEECLAPSAAVHPCCGACVRLANPCSPSRVLKPNPLTLLVGADDRLSRSAAPNSWPRPSLCSVAIFVACVSISVGAA